MQRRQRRTSDRHDDGFTMLEVVVAMTLFGVLLSTVAVALGSMLKHVDNNQNRTVAANLAERVIDRLHAIPAAQLPEGSLPDQQFKAGGQAFTVRASAVTVSDGAHTDPSGCDGSGALSAKRVSVSVTWPGMGSTEPVRSDTLRQLSVSELDLTHGTIALPVLDRDGKPVVGQVVGLAPTGLTATTTDSGCAVFGGLTPGTYTASLVRVGFVDPLGAAVPSRSITVQGGEMTRDEGFSFDRAAALQVVWVPGGSDTLTTYPLLPGTGLSVGGALFPNQGRAYPLCGAPPCSTATTNGVRVTGLFPAADGYRPWAGSCADAKPSASPASVLLAPGGTGTPTVNVPVGRVQVAVTTSAGAAKNGATVAIKHAADSGCAAISTSMTAGATTNKVQLSLPAGTWSFSSGSGAVVLLQVQPGSSVQMTTVKQ